MKARGSFWIGLVVGAIAAAAVLFSVWYVPRHGLRLGGRALPLTAVFEEAHGLHPGSAVLVSGVEAGEVVDVRLGEIPGLGWRVLVTAQVFDGDRYGPMLTTASRYEARRSGLLGDVALAVTPGGGGAPVEPGMLVDGASGADLGAVVDDLGHVSRRLADFMDGRQPGDPSLRRALTELQATLENLRALSEKLPK